MQLKFQRAEWIMLRGDEELALKGDFGRAAVESFCGREMNEVGIVVGFGDMRQNEEARTGVESVGGGKVFADNVIGKMAGAAHDALLDIPRIGPDFEHFEIVIGFEDKAISVAQMEFDEFGKIAEIRDDGDFGSVGAKRVADGIGGIVGNGKRRNFNIADGEFFAGADVFSAVELFGGGFRKVAQDFSVSSFGQIGRGAKMARELRKPAGVIGVLVGDENGVDALGIFVESGETAKSFFAAKSGVDEEAGALGFEQRGIA